MTIGATTGKEPDHIDDADLMSLDEMRGAMKDLSKAALTNVEKATVVGVLKEMGFLKKQMAEELEQMNNLIRMYSTLRLEFDQFKQQRIAELTMRVNHGSTTPGD